MRFEMKERTVRATLVVLIAALPLWFWRFEVAFGAHVSVADLVGGAFSGGVWSYARVLLALAILMHIVATVWFARRLRRARRA